MPAGTQLEQAKANGARREGLRQEFKEWANLFLEFTP